MAEEEKWTAEEHVRELPTAAEELHRIAEEHARAAEEKKLTADKRLWRAAEEWACEDHEAIEKRVHENLELEASNN